MIIYVSRCHRGPRRRVPAGRVVPPSLVFGVSLVAAFLFAFWPLLAFERHWTTVATVQCWQNPGGDSCQYDPFSGTWSGSWVQTAQHSAVTPLGIVLTLVWLGLLGMLAVGFALLARRRRY